MDSRDKTKLGIVVVLLVAAGIILYVSLSGGADIPETDETKTIWFCTETQKGFELTGKEAATMVRMQRAAPAGDGEASAFGASRGRVKVAKSPFSEEWTGVPAKRDSATGEIVPIQTEDDE